jgi:hypothetical protein
LRLLGLAVEVGVRVFVLVESIGERSEWVEEEDLRGVKVLKVWVLRNLVLLKAKAKGFLRVERDEVVVVSVVRLRAAMVSASLFGNTESPKAIYN